MSATFITLIQRVLENQGQYRALSVTGTPSTTVITDSKLRRFVAAADVLNDRWWVYMTLLNSLAVGAADQKRLVIDSTTTTATVDTVFSASTATADTYLLLPFDPDFVKAALNKAGRDLYSRGLYLPVYDKSLIVDNLLSNSNFTGSVTSHAFSSWTRGGSATVTAETTIVRVGSQSAKIVGSGSAEGQQYQAPHVFHNEMTGKTVFINGHVYATVADRARLRVNFDDTTYQSHAYHSGKDQWEYQEITTSIPSDATKLEAICAAGTAAAVGTGYFNQVAMCIDPIYEYAIPSSILKGPYTVEQQVDERKVGRDALFRPLSAGFRPVRGRTLRLKGKGAMTALSADSDTVEVSNDQADILVAQATHNLYVTLMGSQSNQKDHYEREAERWAFMVDKMISEGKAKGPMQGADKPEGWRIYDDGETRRLILTGNRG